MIEFRTVASGITAADQLLKAADVQLVWSAPVCPGKYLAVITGDISAVRAAIEAAESYAPDRRIDSFLLGNPHESIPSAIGGTNEIHTRGAVGVVETETAASAVVAADTAAKTADVELIEIRLARGMCGKSYVLLTGSVSAVTAAVETAAGGVEAGKLLDTCVIAGPDDRLWDSIL